MTKGGLGCLCGVSPSWKTFFNFSFYLFLNTNQHFVYFLVFVYFTFFNTYGNKNLLQIGVCGEEGYGVPYAI